MEVVGLFDGCSVGSMVVGFVGACVGFTVVGVLDVGLDVVGSCVVG